jgi:hypothetical protein
MAANSDYWFGAEHDRLNQQLCVFAQTGGDGSIAAFWLSDSGEIKIVHIGSGSGSTLTGILTNDSVDFLRLLAIGYDEICWDEEFAEPPLLNTNFKVMPNVEFQDWVENTFCVAIPKTALEIVKIPSLIDDEEPMDEFEKWYQKFLDY